MSSGRTWLLNQSCIPFSLLQGLPRHVLQGPRTRTPGHELMGRGQNIDNRKENCPNTQSCSPGSPGMEGHGGCKDGVKMSWRHRWRCQEKTCPGTSGSPGKAPRPFLRRGYEILDAKVTFANHTTGSQERQLPRATGENERMLTNVWRVTGKCLCPHQWKSSPESNKLVLAYPVKHK